MPSLKGFREQAKKAPIYMQEKKSENSFDFDDLNEEPNSDQIPPVPYDADDDTAEEKEEPSDVEETTSPQKGRKATRANKQRAITSRRGKQAKKAPIYMQEKKSENSFDFDDLNEEP